MGRTTMVFAKSYGAEHTDEIVRCIASSSPVAISRSAGIAHDLNVDTEDVESRPLKISLSRFAIRVDCVVIEYLRDRCEVEAVRITNLQFKGT